MLENKLIVVTGVASRLSIAYGIAKQLSNHGARLIITAQNDRLKERVAELTESLTIAKILTCDVMQPDHIAQLHEVIATEFENKLDGLVHAIAYAPSDQLEKSLVDVITQEGFRTAHEVSSYSFCALVKALKEPLQKAQGSVVTLTYLGSTRAVPHYNVMGLAKASLEAAVRYLAASLGEDQVRVNAISSGPIKTLAASGIKGFRGMLARCAQQNFLKRNIDAEEIGKVATFLLSSYASSISGEVLYADAGYSKAESMG